MRVSVGSLNGICLALLLLLLLRGAPIAAGRAAATPAPPPSAVERPSTGVILCAAAVVVLARRGADKSKVHRDGLLKELSLVGTVDGGAGFFEGGVFDEGVSLG